MAKKLHLRGGKLIVDASGHPKVCLECPCPTEPPVEPPESVACAANCLPLGPTRWQITSGAVSGSDPGCVPCVDAWHQTLVGAAGFCYWKKEWARFETWCNWSRASLEIFNSGGNRYALFDVFSWTTAPVEHRVQYLSTPIAGPIDCSSPITLYFSYTNSTWCTWPTYVIATPLPPP